MDKKPLGRRLILALIHHRFICLALGLLILFGGYWSMKHIPLDSFPDITPIRVEVDTEVDGMATEEVEKLVTYPIEQALRGIPNSETVSSESKFSLSVVEVKFKPGTDLYWARSQVFENLGNATLPANVVPSMAPMDEGTGQIYIYTLTSHKLNNMQLRTLQDFVVKPQLRVVSGVADVPIFGGYVKQYQVVVNPDRLTALGLSLDDVVTALGNNNSSVGGNYLAHGSMQYVIRGLGLVRNLDDIRQIVVATPNSVPVHIGDIAEVRFDPEDRQGAVSVNGQGEVVAGIVLKRLGENTAEVIENLQEKLAEIQKDFSHGRSLGLDTSDVKVVTLYDQAYLIKQSTHTVSRSLLEGALLIVIILLLFMGSLSASIIPILANIFCIAVAFLLMKQTNISANLLSLGGLALSLGMMVDATVMILENVYRHVREVDHGNAPHDEVVAAGVAEILAPTVLAVLVIIAVFVPVMTLKGIEGQLFIPLALAVVYSMFGSLLFAVGIAPGLSFWLLSYSPEHHDKPNFLMRGLLSAYEPPLRFAVQYPWVVLLVTGALLVVSFITFWFTGSEFLPPLEESNFRLRLTFPPSMSLPYAMQFTHRLEGRILHLIPEADEVVSYVGRPELGGDPESLSNDEVYIRLKPVDQWRPGMTKAKLEEIMRQDLVIPGTNVQFSQELEMRTDEMISGFNTPISVYVLGEDTDDLMKAAEAVKKILASTPGTVDVGVEHLTGIDNLDIVPDRAKMARYGATVAGVLDVVQGAVGGATAGQVFLQNQRFDIIARVDPTFRLRKGSIERLLVNTGSGAKVPLKDLANVKFDMGFDHVDRYNGMRRIVVTADVQKRSVGSVVADAKAHIDSEVTLPPGVSLYWGGQAEEASHAFESLAVAVPAALIIVFLLIYSCFDNVTDTFIVLSSIPLGLAGGTFLLMFMNLHLNVPAYIGFIAKFGIAVQNGMIMVSYMNTLRTSGLSAPEAAIQASLTRLRPEMLSALIGSVGLFPFLLAAGTGATVERPLAAVVIGGVIVSRPMAWFLLPALYAWWKKGHDAPALPPTA